MFLQLRLAGLVGLVVWFVLFGFVD